MIIRHDIHPHLYLANSDLFPAVFQVANHQEDEILVCDGMGMLIASSWVLTAAHVADEIESTKDYLTIADKRYDIRQIILHSLWKDDEEIIRIKNDIALIQLTQPVLDILPIPLYFQDDELGQSVTFMGWGDFGTGLTGVEKADGQFRLATNRIEEVDEQWLVFYFDKPPDTTDLEGISGPGDSGGPALIQTESGWSLAGISSGQDLKGNEKEGVYGVWEYYVRISKYLDWISSIQRL
ncbi:MAG: trypsin-like serine protease [Cyanobacteria bacterium J06626_4]